MSILSNLTNQYETYSNLDYYRIKKRDGNVEKFLEKLLLGHLNTKKIGWRSPLGDKEKTQKLMSVLCALYVLCIEDNLIGFWLFSCDDDALFYLIFFYKTWCIPWLGNILIFYRMLMKLKKTFLFRLTINQYTRIWCNLKNGEQYILCMSVMKSFPINCN